MEQIILLVALGACAAWLLWNHESKDKQVRELEDTIDRLQSDVLRLYCENQNYRQAIVSHCMLTESVSPNLDTPFDTIHSVIDWHLFVNEQDFSCDVSSSNINVGAGGDGDER